MASFKPLPATKRCPQCGTLSPPFEDLPDRPGWVKCAGVISDCLYEECRFRVPVTLLRRPVVRIAGSGYPGNGQSTWNCVAHARMWRNARRPPLFMSRLECPDNDAVDSRYDDLLAGLNLPATEFYGSRDASSSLLGTPRFFGGLRELVVRVEDFGGEWVQLRSSGESRGERRLLECDAFILFVDPIQGPDRQLPHFAEFCAFLKRFRSGHRRPLFAAPLALVVPKLSLLMPLASAATSADRVERLMRDLKTSGPMNEDTTLAAINRRRHLAIELSYGVFPLQRYLSHFESVAGPDQVQVFPMATLGWSEEPYEHLGALGPERGHDYLLRESFGVLDPLLWVLHQLKLRRLPAG